MGKNLKQIFINSSKGEKVKSGPQEPEAVPKHGFLYQNIAKTRFKTHKSFFYDDLGYLRPASALKGL